ncbi:MFS transporter [Actinomadura sp. 9N407]|uniref:MFS transporter n=1 Tax=Actinomadura sp. 9N407 TaxID=3375154 RepID=UPI0037B52C67
MRLPYARELDEYPTGSKRIKILAMAVLAVLIGSYEAQIAPVVPLLLDDFDMSLSTYGMVSGAGALSGAIASIIGGRLVDVVGRVKLLVPLMMVTALCCFAMTLTDSVGEFLVARIALAFVDGMAIAGTAPLVRDFSPRMGRAQAFGFWTWGPVGASFLAAGVAAWTLPMFDDEWRSQFIIMGVVSLIVSVVIAANIADLSPELRARIQQTEESAKQVVADTGPPHMRDLFAHRHVWAHVVGISLWLVLYITLVLYGQTMLAHTFEISAAKASSIMSAFWILNLGSLIVVGRLSDRLQLRKPFVVGGTLATIAAAGYLAVLMGRESASVPELMITGGLIGASMGVAYCPWMAAYSEDTEDIDPRLQGTAWGIFGFLTKGMAVIALIIVPHVVEAGSWQIWLLVALVCLALFIPAVFLFKGPWRRGGTGQELPADTLRRGPLPRPPLEEDPPVDAPAGLEVRD